MIHISEGRVCIKCGLSKKWSFYYEKHGSKFGYQSSCKKCVDAEQSIRRSIAKLAEPGYTAPIINNIGISPFRSIIPTVPEKVVDLRTDRNDYSTPKNYWEDKKEFGEKIELGSRAIPELYKHIMQ